MARHGVRRRFAISTRRGRTIEEADRPVIDAYPPPSRVASLVLNAIFLDQFDGDALRLERINHLLKSSSRKGDGTLRPIDLLLLRPSDDLGRLANQYEPRLPRTFRFLTRGFGTREARANDLLSLVMFQPDYLKRLIELGQRDAEERLDEILAFTARPVPA